MSERFIWFENGYGQTALKLGIISPSMFERFIQYKIYLDLLDQGKGHMEAIKEISDEYNCGVTTVRDAVRFFSHNNLDEAI